MAEMPGAEITPGDEDTRSTSIRPGGRERKAKVSGIDTHITGFGASRRIGLKDLDDAYDERTSYMRGLAVSYVLSSKYEIARSLLRDIMGRQTYEDYDCMLLWTECDMYLNKGCNNVLKLRRDHLVTAKDISCAEVLEWSNSLDVKGCRLGSIILLRVFKDKLKEDDNYLQHLPMVGDLAYSAAARGSYMVTQGGDVEKEVAQRYVKQVVAEMKEDLQLLGNNDVSMLAKAKCNLGMALLCCKIDYLPEAILELEIGRAKLEGIEEMDRSQFIYYFVVLKVLWRTCFNSGDVMKALELSELRKNLLIEHGASFMAKEKLEDALKAVETDQRSAFQRYNTHLSEPIHTTILF